MKFHNSIVLLSFVVQCKCYADTLLRSKWRMPYSCLKDTFPKKDSIERSIQPDSWIARMTCTRNHLNQFRSYALARLDVLYDFEVIACDWCCFHTVNPNSSNHWRSCLADKYMNLFAVYQKPAHCHCFIYKYNGNPLFVSGGNGRNAFQSVGNEWCILLTCSCGLWQLTEWVLFVQMNTHKLEIEAVIKSNDT